ncbi:MAG: phage tail tape measure protein, partial [Candidatus Sumerlaeales bacterium]|nr:phage tail tape measure protein [Candidatus Sumerlaeales bacterium]
MADDLKIVVKALLDEKDLRAQTEAIKDVTIHGKIVIDKADLKKQIDSIAGESSKFGNKFKIKYGVDKGDFVKQFRVAGEEAKKQIDKVLSGSGSPVKINVDIDGKAVAQVKEKMDSLGFDASAIQKATQFLKDQNVTVTEISQGYRTINKEQQELVSLTLKGIDAEGSLYNITERYNVSKNKSLEAVVKINSKLNEQGDIVNKMATKMQPKDIGTIKAEESEILKRFVSNLQKANEYTGDMRATADSLGVSLNNAFSNQEITTYRNQLSIAKEQFRALQAEAARVAALPTTKIDTNVSSLNTSLAYQGMDAQTAGITNLRNEINSLITEYSRLKVSMDGLDPNSAEFQALGVQVDALDTRFKSATKAAELFNGSFSNKTKLAGIDDQIRKAKSSLEELELKWSKFKGNPALLTEFKELQAAAQQLDATNLQNFNKQLASFKTNVRAAGADTRSFGNELKNALAKFGLWITASSIFMQAWRGVRRMVDSVKELDAALVEFNKVADLSSSQLDKFVDRAFEAGEALGRTGTIVLEASARFKQAGYNVDESLALAQTSLMMMNVGDGIDTAERAASDLIASLKGFRLEVGQSQQVLDALNNTSNNTAIGFNNLSEGVSRIAGTLSQSGTTMQQTMGLLVGGFSSLRNIEKVSSGLVMISQRMRAVTEDGEAIEGLAPKLESAFQEIVGVSIKGPDGELRSTYDLLSDLQKKWDSLTSSQQQYIG